MKNMTVRGVQPELEEKLRQAADAADKSVNQTILDALTEYFGLGKKKRFTAVHHNMDHLFGRWSAAEFKRIQGRIDAGRQVDDELWQ